MKNWGWKLAALIIVIGLCILIAGCQKQKTGNGDSKPQAPHTTSVGPSSTASASVIPKDETVVFPKNQIETNYATAHGATFICGDGGMSFKSSGGACVGHGGISEVVRK